MIEQQQTKDTQMQVFNNDTFGALEVVILEDKPMFIAKQISNILGYSATGALNKIIDDEDKYKRVLQNGINYVNQSLITESGLYQAIFGSTKPEAKQFKKWVTSEVLPSIRKTGKYEIVKKSTLEIASSMTADQLEV